MCSCLQGCFFHLLFPSIISRCQDANAFGCSLYLNLCKCQEEDEQPQLDIAGLSLSGDPYDGNFGEFAC